MCIDDKFSNPFNSYLDEDAFYNFINSMLGESKYCSGMMKKHFNKELVMSKRDDEDSENSIKFWVCDNDYVDGNVKLKDYCHITGKCRGSAYRDCNIRVKLNHNITIVFHNLKNYDSHFIMQGIGKFHFKINNKTNGSKIIYEI